MSKEQDLQQIELTIENAKKYVEIAEDMFELEQNPKFKRLFIDGYLRDYAAFQVQQRANVQTQYNADAVRAVDNNITGIGCFGEYIRMLKIRGINAKDAILKNEQEREILLQEEDEA